MTDEFSELINLLHQIEWAARETHIHNHGSLVVHSACPMCGRTMREGHNPHCLIKYYIDKYKQQYQTHTTTDYMHVCVECRLFSDCCGHKPDNKNECRYAQVPVKRKLP